MVKEKITHPASNPSLDWGYLFFLSRTKLNLTEEEFWDSSVEKIKDLMDVYAASKDEKYAKRRKQNLSKERSDKNGEIFIDQVNFL